MSKSAGNGSSLLSRTKKLLRQSGLRARKGLGQHFLIDDEVLHDILTAAGLSPQDTVIEVGPGLGILTRELSARAVKRAKEFSWAAAAKQLLACLEELCGEES